MPSPAAPAGLPGWGAAALFWAFALGISDLRHRRLPNALTFGGALVGLASLALTGASPLGAGGLSVLAGAGLALLLTLPGFLLRQLGAGDVKVLLAVACLGGAAATLVAFVVGALLAGAATLGWMFLGERLGRQPRSGRRLPFGAALALGFVVAVLGNQTGDPTWLRW